MNSRDRQTDTALVAGSLVGLLKANVLRPSHTYKAKPAFR